MINFLQIGNNCDLSFSVEFRCNDLIFQFYFT